MVIRFCKVCCLYTDTIIHGVEHTTTRLPSTLPNLQKKGLDNAKEVFMDSCFLLVSSSDAEICLLVSRVSGGSALHQSTEDTSVKVRQASRKCSKPDHDFDCARAVHCANAYGKYRDVEGALMQYT